MGLMCNRAKCTCFSVAVSNSIWDINFRTGHTRPVMRSFIFVGRVS